MKKVTNQFQKWTLGALIFLACGLINTPLQAEESLQNNRTNQSNEMNFEDQTENLFDHDFQPPPELRRPGRRPPPPPRYYGCNDQQIVLQCKVKGDGIKGSRSVYAYTDCARYGTQPEGSYCHYVYTPGFYQLSMRVEFVCQNGQWVWTLGSHGNCELRTDY